MTQTMQVDQVAGMMNAGAGVDMDSDDRKLFIGGLSWETTREDLIQYFGQFGAISSVSIKYNAITGNPRGFAFVTFASDGSIDAVLDGGPHSLNNKVVDPRRAKTRPNSKKIFVGGLDSNMSEEDIRHYFSRFGEVKGVELPVDRMRGRRREFGFVIFDSEAAADLACAEAKQVIGSRDCDIKKAQPQNQVQNQKRYQHQFTPASHHHYQPAPQMHDAQQAAVAAAAFGMAGYGGWSQEPMSTDAYGGWRDHRMAAAAVAAAAPRNNGPPMASGSNNGQRYHRGRVYVGSGVFNNNGQQSYGY